MMDYLRRTASEMLIYTDDADEQTIALAILAVVDPMEDAALASL